MRHSGTYEDVVLAWKVIVISYIGPFSKSKQYLHKIFFLTKQMDIYYSFQSLKNILVMVIVE